VTPPQRAVPRPTQKSASPADRSARFIETQRRLKRKAAERRLNATDDAAITRPGRRSATGKTRKRG
jgi:hypothetical protein